MRMIDAQTMFDHFEEMNKVLSIDELMEKFDNSRYEEIYAPIQTLIYKGWIEEKGRLIWGMTIKARNKIKENAEKDKQAAERSSKEYQKLQLEIDDLISKVSDYDTVRSQAKQSITYSFISAAAAVIAILIALLKK